MNKRPATTPPTSLSTRRRRQLEDLADRIDILPGSFVVPMRILELSRDLNAGMNDYANVLSADASLVARILGLVNSAAFSPTAPITRLPQALSMIGLKNLMPLLFGTSLAGIFNQFSIPSGDRRQLWRSSVFKAVAAREYCKAVASPMAEEAFLCGLLQDIALPIILASDRSSWPEITQALDETDPEERLRRETRLLGIEHGHLAERVIERLGLPDLFSKSVALHHAASDELIKNVKNPQFAAAIQLAAELPHRGNRLSQPEIQRLSLRMQLLPSSQSDCLDSTAAQNLVRQIADESESMLKMLGDADEKSVAFKEFMQHLSREVTRCLGDAIGSSTTEISGLKSREVEMQERMEELREQAAQSDTDSLTSVLNRRGLDRRLPKWLAAIGSSGRSCLIGYADLDNFKQINDRVGHAAGDAALIRVAELMKEVTGRQGLAARLGGDEFTLLYVPKTPDQLDQFVTQFRNAMSRCEFAHEGETISFSASIGLLCLDAKQLKMPATQIMQKADELMYSVKQNGKGGSKLARLTEDNRLLIVDQFGPNSKSETKAA